MNFSSLPKQYSAFSPWYLLATWFHSGRITPASGTWGTIAALPFIYVVYQQWSNTGLAVMASVLFAVGYFAAQDYTNKTGEKDASPIVIDEVVGMTIALIPAVTFDLTLWGVAFVLFRIFDAVKVGPVGWCDRKLPGAYGVMIDDVVAGIMTAIGITAYQLYLG